MPLQQHSHEISGELTRRNLTPRNSAFSYTVLFPIGLVDQQRHFAKALALDQLPKVIWMQLRVRNDEAAERAEAKGIRVVMNRCPKMEYGKLSGEWAWVGGNSGLISSRRQTLHHSGRIQSLGIGKKP